MKVFLAFFLLFSTSIGLLVVLDKIQGIHFGETKRDLLMFFQWIGGQELIFLGVFLVCLVLVGLKKTN